MTRILVISSLFSGAKDEYSCQICLGMKVTQTSYVVVLNAINQCLASQTRTRNIRWQNKTCLFHENSGKKDRSRRSYSINLPILSASQIIKFSTWLTLYSVLMYGKDENTTSNVNFFKCKPLAK